MTPEEKEKAEAILANYVWQPAEGHNYRYAKAVNSLTRFVEAASMQPDEVKLVIEYLKGQEISGSIDLLNRKVDFGTGWKAKDAWYQTAVGEKWANTDSTRIRIYQVLIQAPADGAGEGPYVVEKGCQYKTSHTFYWNVESLPSLPNAESGVEYALRGVIRNDETGLWSCVIEKRERLEQEIAEYQTGETAFEKTNEEQHFGVKQSQVSSRGKKASVGDGKRVTRRIRKNADCTSDVENQTIEEKPKKGTRKTYRKTLRAVTEAVTDRSQTEPVDAQGLAVGETRTSEMTEGQLWNNTVEKTKPIPVGKVAESCAKSDVVHTDMELKNQVDEPTVEQPEPGVNEEFEAEARRTEENTWDFKKTKRTYKAKSVETTGGTPVVRTRRKVGINQPEKPTGGAGGTNVVKSATATPNDHGSYSTTEEETEYLPKSVETISGSPVVRTRRKVGINQPDKPTGGTGGTNVVKSASATPNEHGSYSTTEEQTEYIPRGAMARGGAYYAKRSVKILKDQLSEHVDEEPAQGKTVDATVTPNEHGSYDKHITVTEVEQHEASVGGKGSQKVRRSVKVVKAAKDQNVDEDPEQGKTVEATVTPNADGTFDKHVTVTKVEQHEGSVSGKGSQKVKRSVKVVKAAKDQNVDEDPEQGKTVEATVTPNADGTFDKHVTVTKVEQHEASVGGKGSQKVKRNVKVVKAAKDQNVSETPSINKDVEATVTPNADGTFDKHIAVTEYQQQTTSATDGTTDFSRRTRIERYTEDSSVSETPTQNQSVEATVVPNDKGSFEKRVSVVTHKPREKEKTWSDRKYFYRLIKYKNQLAPIMPTGDNDDATASYELNGHGTYDGMVLYKNLKAEQGSTLQLESHCDVKSAITYMKDGKLMGKEVKAKKHFLFGKAPYVMEKMANAPEVAQVGWRTSFQIRNVNEAYGVYYSNIEVGKEKEYEAPT